MLSKGRYENMRKKYGGVSSWRIWGPEGATARAGVGDLSIFDPVDLQVLNCICWIKRCRKRKVGRCS